VDWAQTLGTSQGDASRADKLARRLALRMNFKGWRMLSLHEDPKDLKLPW
jgi:hypothetical protein